MYQQQNQTRSAAAEYEKALAVEPHNPSLMLELAQQYYKMVEVEKALDLIRKVIAWIPNQKRPTCC